MVCPCMQALCFLAGANSIFDGDKLLTTPNTERSADMDVRAPSCLLHARSYFPVHGRIDVLVAAAQHPAVQKLLG